ncbi:type II secretion system F family protein [Novosphingobium sp. Fuku2-ISO-50]|jgi:tight adherence protein B|uniref:type II secretion system F family protein n=1 Tax=Novosphingobium sp. Fuku2-ISO-50 TaxID=1739114 RepID=UPI00076BE3D5|nr:type II secretion system F family protein [Novosphingobium sp. Fuku2-ISO-50]KUR81195.1 pilus assembly protein TadB [Novosphingobium sp. Fuku2-ISO-50]
MQSLPIMILVFGAVFLLGLLAIAFTGPNAKRESSRRLQAIKLRHSENAVDKVEAQFRKAVAQRKPTSYKVAGSQSRSEALRLRLLRTGKGWTVQQYIYSSLGLTLALALLIGLKSGSMLLGLAIGIVIGAGLPHLVVNYQIGRRINAFITRFPDALELLTRGLRSGLPISETLTVVANELPGPVAEEFKLVTDRIRLGRTMEDSLQETANRLDLAEFSFFCITLAIQRETGGNLAETLANLADVLRKRAQMKLKIKAMSSESKASAYIIGSLPFIVFFLIYSINPTYMGRFFIDERLIIAGIGAFIWLSLGAFIMSRMINFEI